MGSADTAFTFSTQSWAAIKTDVLVVPIFKEKDTLSLTSSLKTLDKSMQGMIQAAAKEEKYNGAKGQIMTLRSHLKDTVGFRRLVLVGLGEEKRFMPNKWESTALKAVRSTLTLKDLKSIAVSLPQNTKRVTLEQSVYGLVDAVHQATYTSQEAKEKGPRIPKMIIAVEKATTASLRTALEQAIALAEARSLAKDLVNKPSNIKSTNSLVDAAKVLGKRKNITVKVQSSASWVQKNMPCFYEVAKGSVATDPPKFITLHYQPPGTKAAAKGKKPTKNKKVAVVGKSVIFDTGGYQVKPGAYMNTMKADMAGGAYVLGVMHALSKLQPTGIEVTAYLAATPNKIDSDAMIPDAVVNTTCGKKVEIRHTDAEGRLTLIDAVAMALKDKKNLPDELVTVATLTGSAATAVGMWVALMGNQGATEGPTNKKTMRQRMEDSARYLGEPFQSLEVVEQDFDDIKSKLDSADICNTSHNKKRGCQSAAAFVMSGNTEDIPMLHLDIAGADMSGDEKATGIGQKALTWFMLTS
ncbi:MAG: hypothetical protein KTR14_07980 [Vampirovibrio sp.]|nr:hypothetical protein [Vampirovibrio sp.]